MTWPSSGTVLPSLARGVALVAWAAALSCSGGDAVGERGSIALRAAALELAGVGDVVWDVEVDNGAEPPEVVWQRRLTSSRFGDGAGGIAYVGPCDASAGVAQHTVKLWVVGAYAAPVADAGAFAAGSDAGVSGASLAIVNPTAAGPLERVVTCAPNADASVRFDVALMRSADQGFFDIAVTFSDVFCSAKLDCDAGDLLHDADGVRGPTMVLGFACTAGAGDVDRTVLYLDDLELDCSSPSAADFTPDLALRVDGPVGNQCTPGALSECGAVSELGAVDADTFLYQVALYRGVEPLGAGSARAVYWNAALAHPGPAIAGCRLRTRGTAAPLAGNDAIGNGSIAAGAVYYITWDVPLGDCGAEALNR
ncbi:MAG: hypothetical protein U1F43_31480 [Myxococcota bacterium]